MSSRQADISRWEWIAAGASALIVAAIIAALVIHARRERTPPDLIVTVDDIRPQSQTFLVRFTVANGGNTTAAEVVVRGELKSEGVVERSEVTFDFVPDGSVRRGGLLFHRNPHDGALSVQAVGFRDP